MFIGPTRPHLEGSGRTPEGEERSHEHSEERFRDQDYEGNSPRSEKARETAEQRSETVKRQRRSGKGEAAKAKRNKGEAEQ
jgi:hypothetical protein